MDSQPQSAPLAQAGQVRGRSLQGYTLVVTASFLWASLGVFYKYLVGNYGLTPLSAAGIRAGIGGVVLLASLAVRRCDLRIARRDWPIFLAYGVIGVAVFFFAYSSSVNLTGVAMAVVLMYTSPAWVALISWRWLGERLSRRTVAALGLALVGVALVSQVYDPQKLQVQWLGVLVGLFAGLTYGLYSVFNKVLVRRYQPSIVQVYGLLIGAAVMLAFVPRGGFNLEWSSPTFVVLLLGMGLVPTLLGSLAFAVGVQWVPVNVASILATLEIAVATLYGYVLFGERLEPGQLIGAASIFGAMLLLRPGREQG